MIHNKLRQMNETEKNGLRMFGMIHNKLRQIKKQPQSQINTERIKIYTGLYNEFKKYKALYMSEWKHKNNEN